jgi:uncharacterized protein YggU (UPF0235/DUF167 family)
MLIKVKSYPSSRKEEIIRKSQDSFEIKIKEKAQRGEANKRIRELLAQYFNVSLGSIVLKKGTREKSKIFEIKKKNSII